MSIPFETILTGLCLTMVSAVLFSGAKAEIDEDMELVQRCLRGDRAAFDLLVEKYYKKIYNLSYRFVGDSEEANDLAQEIFTAAYQNLKKFRGDAKFSTWLFQIATNRGKNRFKYLKRRGYFANKSQSDGDEEKEGLQRAVPDFSYEP